MSKLSQYVNSCALAACFAAFGTVAAAAAPPNIVLIYADDIGYGDFGCYGAVPELETPHVDALAAEGLRFTDAYSSSATCTPSRYSLLTGEHAFRQEGTGILRGDAAMIIAPGRATLPSTLRDAGYRTGVVGKWHLGLGDGAETINWNEHVAPGPNEIGFDYSFIMAATGDRVPCVFLENGDVIGLDADDPIEVSYKKPFPGEPTGITHRDQLKMDWSHGHNMAVVNNIGRIGYMHGGKSALWSDEDMADEFVRQAVDFIDREKDNRFFLYFATHDNHVPRVPHPRFAGASGMGPRADAIVQFDWCVGEILAALERNGLSDDTLVILTSDNGPVLDDGYKDDANEKLGDHSPAGPLRAGKYSNFEGGTRAPFIVRWPGRVKPGESGAIISQVDLPATLATLAGGDFDDSRGEDSMDLLPALLGERPAGRDQVLQYASAVSLREGPWKFIPPSTQRDGLGPWTSPEVEAPGMLFNLDEDPGETHNLAGEHPERVAAMSAQLAVLVAGRERAEENNSAGWTPIFDGKSLEGWTPKVTGYESGENPGNLFRVEDGVIKVSYDQFEKFEGQFGHLFYNEPLSRYKLRLEYRFVGEQTPGGPAWAFRNSGLMLHGQAPETMEKDQKFPISIEGQFLGGDGKAERSTGNLCTPDTQIVMDGQVVTKHCISSTSKTFHGDQWVRAEFHVMGEEEIIHFINGEEVLRYYAPQLDDGTLLDHGTISLQAESHGCEFRNIEVMRLD